MDEYGYGFGDASMGMGFAMPFFSIALFWILLGIPLWRILTRAGFSGVWVLLLIVPPVGWLVITLVLAFAQWPARALRREGAHNVL